jgi:hypothetical protein
MTCKCRRHDYICPLPEKPHGDAVDLPRALYANLGGGAPTPVSSRRCQRISGTFVLDRL